MKSAQPYQTTSQGYEEGIHWSRRIFHTSNGILALLFYHRDKVLFQKVVGVSFVGCFANRPNRWFLVFISIVDMFGVYSVA
jgi:hypothetical protein